MPVFIAKDSNGKVENIVLAKSLELATAYWQGRDVWPISVIELSDDHLREHATGVLPVLNTRLSEIYLNGKVITYRAVLKS